ncbi:hypothetical protein [Spirosoma sp. KNUC1025]|uniref:hypothetical protein n=1 Tax=Spirosoma sp. KNUC1025 TaxID=2894082 RepID=UPI0038688A1D|nr:hypothetical protein LN737_24305 [Spirosoma sp. KNUC1025]
MKKLLNALLVGLLLVGCSKSSGDVTPAVTETNLVGKWEDVDAYPSGAAHRYYEFKSDKTCTVTNNYSSGPITLYKDAPWSIVGNVLHLKFSSLSDDCNIIVLPDAFSDKLNCKNIGINTCSYTYKGTEKSDAFTLVKQ